MRTIKFSHFYKKMPEGYEISKLLEIFVADRKDLHECFILYDTSHGDGENYPLPKGKLIVMLLQTRDSKELWTTMRRCTPSKLKYYVGLRSSYVNCEVNE